MRTIPLLAGTLALVIGVLTAEVSAAELKVLSAGAMRAVLQDPVMKVIPSISSCSSTIPGTCRPSPSAILRPARPPTRSDECIALRS
jgi:hypothetical protein